MNAPESAALVAHEEPHLDPDGGVCWCSCAACTDVPNDLCVCPDCPGGCDLEHALARAARLRAEADVLLAQADALVRGEHRV